MMAAIAPQLSRRYAEIAMSLDNLHVMHDGSSDVPAGASVQRGGSGAPRRPR